MKTLTTYLPSFAFLLLSLCLSYLTYHLLPIREYFEGSIGSGAGVFLSLILLVLIGVAVYRFAPKTPLPVFAWAVIFGIALQLPLLPLLHDISALLFLIELTVAFVLFTAGISIPIKNFKRYFAPIAVLSVFGTILSVILFASGLLFITSLYGLEVSVLSLLLLGAILSSIDPGTVIPTLERLHFKRPFLRDIAIAESATNDVVGIVLTRFFLVAILGTTGVATLTLYEGFIPLFSRGALEALSIEIVWGLLVGALGAWILKTWGESRATLHWTDPALFFSVPLFCFSLGSTVGGSGFLAAFIAGLLFETSQHTKEVHRFFENLVDYTMKPAIFVLLGALAPLSAVVDYFLIGTIAAIFFMFFVRPLVVFISLSPWMVKKNSLLHWRELLFLSFIRETGAIPAILVLYIITAGVLGAEFLYAIALWVILYTLIIEPPLTPALAKCLEIASEKNNL